MDDSQDEPVWHSRPGGPRKPPSDDPKVQARREYDRAYYAKNKERLRAYRKPRQHLHAELQKKWKQEHRDAYLKRHREWMKAKYASDPEYREQKRQYQINYRRSRMKPLLDLMDEARTNGCCLCGERDPACLDFHHRDPSTKSFNIAPILHRISWLGRIDEVRAELAKCDVVCANCHRKIHGEGWAKSKRSMLSDS